MTDPIDTIDEPRHASNDGGSQDTGGKQEKGKGSIVTRLALTAVNSQVSRVSEVLTGAADSIDEILGSSSALPDVAKNFVSTTSKKLRELADLTTEEEASKLIENLQRTAASHPAATAGVGAALGAALGLALSKLGSKAAPAQKASAPKTAKA